MIPEDQEADLITEREDLALLRRLEALKLRVEVSPLPESRNQTMKIRITNNS